MIKKTQTQRLIYRLLNAVALTIDDIGYANTISLLNSGRTLQKKDTDKMNLCSNAVITTFNMTMSELLNGTQKKYPRKYAFAIWVYLCNQELGYTLKELGEYLNKDKSGLSRAKRIIQTEMSKGDNKFDMLIMNKLDECKEKLNQYIINTTSYEQRASQQSE
jgi:hypothetical protein